MTRVRRPFEPVTEVVVKFRYPTRTIRDADVVKECDIHYLYSNMLKFGTAYPGRLSKPARTPQFIQSVFPQDLATAMDIVSKAREQFDQLPVEVRDKFNYNPYRFMEFVTNDKNKEELVKMGLANIVEPVKTLAQEVAEIIKPNGELDKKSDEGQA